MRRRSAMAATVDQAETELGELRVDLERTHEVVREQRLQLIRRRRIEKLCNEPSHRTALCAEKIVDFGKHEWRDNDSRRAPQGRRVL